MARQGVGILQGALGVQGAEGGRGGGMGMVQVHVQGWVGGEEQEPLC